jgi:hypothetical protein
MAAREDRLAVLNAELLQAVGVDHLKFGHAVVEACFRQVAGLAHLDADMAQPVELGTRLADLGGQELVVTDQPVSAEPGAHRRDPDVESALAVLRHRRLVDAANAVDLAVLDDLDGVENLGRRDPVGRTGLVVLAPFGMGPPRLVGQCRCRRRCRLLGMGGAGSQGAGGNGAADQAGCQEGTTLLVDLLRRLLEPLLVVKIIHVHGRSLLCR